MKKLVFFAVAMLFSLGVAAQEDKMKDDKIAMKDGKVWVWEKGQKSALVDDRVLSNGTKVSATGNVTMADGTTTTLVDGDKVGMDGVILRNETKKERETKLPK